MASMLLLRRAGRYAAPSVSSIASPSAALATSGSGRFLCRFPVALWSGRGLGSHAHGSPVFDPPRSNPDTGYVDFVADAKDLESDEALWALYERWCETYREERSQDEMRLRFNEFKKTVFLVDRSNKEAIMNGESMRLVISRFADGKLWELMAPKVKCYFPEVPPNVRISGGFGPLPVRMHYSIVTEDELDRTIYQPHSDAFSPLE